ncbi:MAG: hypothetical protein AB1665_09095 [Candidatus Thermoplasmatota archaeon]
MKPHLHAAASALQDNGGNMQAICIYIIALIIVLVVLYVALFVYQRFFSKRAAGQRACRYCGHMVDLISDCHHAPVLGGFPRMTCAACNRPARALCAQCKRPIA